MAFVCVVHNGTLVLSVKFCVRVNLALIWNDMYCSA